MTGRLSYLIGSKKHRIALVLLFITFHSVEGKRIGFSELLQEFDICLACKIADVLVVSLCVEDIGVNHIFFMPASLVFQGSYISYFRLLQVLPIFFVEQGSDIFTCFIRRLA
jgi:hypothetical protein